jgi:acetyl esterase/lipase
MFAGIKNVANQRLPDIIGAVSFSSPFFLPSGYMITIFRFFCMGFILISVISEAQEKIFIYPSGAMVTHKDFDKDSIPPYLLYFKAPVDSADGAAILICPGGSYTMLSEKLEGTDVAKFYNAHGYSAFVLHYRLNNGKQQGHRFPDQYTDVTTAMKLIKSRAAEWRLDPSRLGILGFSAGGHLASMCATMESPAKGNSGPASFSSRPAFAILIYPVIALAGEAAHQYSREMLLGKNPDPARVDSLSTYRRVDERTPPTFLVYANDDKAVPPENGILFYQALRAHKVPASLHIYDHGGHGFGLAQNDPELNSWTGLSIQWLNSLTRTKK